MTDRSEVIIKLSPPGLGGSLPPDQDASAPSTTGRDRPEEPA
jgi:hypothetical protein